MRGMPLAARCTGGFQSFQHRRHGGRVRSSEVIVMKSSAIWLAISLIGATGTAVAGGPGPGGQPLNLSSVRVTRMAAECGDASRVALRDCVVLDRLIAADFTPAQRGMIAAWETSHPDWLVDRILGLADRHNEKLWQYIAMERARGAGDVPYIASSP